MSVSTPRRALALAAAAGLAVLAACDRTAEDPLVGATPPVQSVYCYVTIADDDCYAALQPGQEARLIRAWPPAALLRPAPPANAASGAP